MKICHVFIFIYILNDTVQSIETATDYVAKRKSSKYICNFKIAYNKMLFKYGLQTVNKKCSLYNIQSSAVRFLKIA